MKKSLILISFFIYGSILFSQVNSIQVPQNLVQKANNLTPKDSSYVKSLTNSNSLKSLNINQIKQNLSPSTLKQVNNLSNSEKQLALETFKNKFQNKENQVEFTKKNSSGSYKSDKIRLSNIYDNIQSNNGLARFGYSIFQQSSQITTSFTPVNDNYILGPGDNLKIYIWGKLEQELEVEISNNGTIVLPKIGEVSIAGINYGSIRQVLIKELNKEFVNFDLSVTIKKLRTIRIFILGNVNTPGAYLVNGMTSVFQALFVSNGVNLSGSLRNIKLIRNGKVISKIDLYYYLLHGNNSHDPILKDNDTIFVETVGPLVHVSGNVKSLQFMSFILEKLQVHHSKKLSIMQAVQLQMHT